MEGKSDWREIFIKYGGIVPSITWVLVGDSVTLHCGSSVPVTWTFKPYIGPASYEILPDRHCLGNYSVILNHLQLEESGFYRCRGYFSDGEAFREVAFVVVSDTVNIGFVLPTRVEVPQGGSVKLVCGSLKPVEWTLFNRTIKYHTHENNTLILKKLKKENSGHFLCRGVNLQKEIFHRSALIIVDPIIQQIPT